MTQSEFIKNYCGNSKIKEKKLNELGLFAMPCDCIEYSCPGWAMVTKATIKPHMDLYIHKTKINEETI